MKRIILLIMCLLCINVASAITIETTTGIVDDTLLIDNIPCEITNIYIKQDIGKHAYDWITFRPTSKFLLNVDVDNGVATIPYHLSIPKDVNVGIYDVSLLFKCEYQQDFTRKIEINIYNQTVKKLIDAIQTKHELYGFKFTSALPISIFFGLILLYYFIKLIKETLE